MKKIFILLAGFSLLLVSLVAVAPVAAKQQVEIPYVVSLPDQGWWTGFAITNNGDQAITLLKLKFITDAGQEGSSPIFDDYQTLLAPIAKHAMRVNTLANLYAGEGDSLHPPELPSAYGSVVLSHPGDEPFSVTVFIGNPAGFAYQVFQSSPAP